MKKTITKRKDIEKHTNLKGDIWYCVKFIETHMTVVLGKSFTKVKEYIDPIRFDSVEDAVTYADAVEAPSQNICHSITIGPYFSSHSQKEWPLYKVFPKHMDEYDTIVGSLSDEHRMVYAKDNVMFVFHYDLPNYNTLGPQKKTAMYSFHTDVSCLSCTIEHDIKEHCVENFGSPTLGDCMSKVSKALVDAQTVIVTSIKENAILSEIDADKNIQRKLLIKEKERTEKYLESLNKLISL